jgi:hypothetical protein
VVRVVLESPVARAGPVAPVGLESPVVLVEPQPEQKLAVAGPALRPPRSRAAVAAALTVSAVINPQRAAEAAALSAEEVGQVPKRPAVAVAPAWAGAAAKAEAAAVKAVVAGADR